MWTKKERIKQTFNSLNRHAPCKQQWLCLCRKINAKNKHTNKWTSKQTTRQQRQCMSLWAIDIQTLTACALWDIYGNHNMHYIFCAMWSLFSIVSMLLVRRLVLCFFSFAFVCICVCWYDTIHFNSFAGVWTTKKTIEEIAQELRWNCNAANEHANCESTTKRLNVCYMGL